LAKESSKIILSSCTTIKMNDHGASLHLLVSYFRTILQKANYSVWYDYHAVRCRHFGAALAKSISLAKCIDKNLQYPHLACRYT
ncbi:7849_t:CDS:1, partial [Gigaspora rosea]